MTTRQPLRPARGEGHYAAGEGITASAYPAVGIGAVLYEDRPDTPDDERRLHHVTDIRQSIDGDAVYYVIADGTHTVEHHYHAEDVLADFEPAGWRWPTTRKPTYYLTRECGVADKQDLMTDGSGQPAEATSSEDDDVDVESELLDTLEELRLLAIRLDAREDVVLAYYASQAVESLEKGAQTIQQREATKGRPQGGDAA